VYVVREQLEVVKWVYKPLELVSGALRILSGVDGHPINEGMVTSWLETIYVGEIAAQWQQLFDSKYNDFQAILRTMRPFESDENLEEQFEKLFDGTEVLPEDLREEYLRRLEGEGLLPALGLLVPVSQRDVARLFKAGKATPEKNSRGNRILVIDAPYDHEYGLDLRSALAKEPPMEAD
jgi:CRISPR-associated endonuclease/helicase Cas3